MLFNEPKLLKSTVTPTNRSHPASFSALQRAEIAEICRRFERLRDDHRVSVLFNEPKLLKSTLMFARSSTESSKNSALQRAEIAEIYVPIERAIAQDDRTVLFNEPKLL